MDRLTPVLFTDDWGSHCRIAALQGRSTPTTRPESELWMGAHESGPATLRRDGRRTTLDRVVSADPLGELGAECVEAHGTRLPFLLKVLAPGRAISIQAHPSAEQAMAERARSGDVVYVDDSAKPELLLAIEPFEVFVGMRPHSELVDLAGRLGVSRFTAMVAAASVAQRPEHAVLAAVLATDRQDVPAFVEDVVAASIRLGSRPGPYAAAANRVAAVSAEHPGDIGAAALLLMRHRILAPGEYVDIAAGVLHSYVSGLGIEVLANSDNVVRAGLTRKPVNIPELLRIVDPAADATVGAGVERTPGVVEYPSAAPCFRLRRIEPGRMLPTSAGPRLVFCLRGGVRLVQRDRALRLGNVESAFLPAGSRDVRLEGSGEVYLVDLP